MHVLTHAHNALQTKCHGNVFTVRIHVVVRTVRLHASHNQYLSRRVSRAPGCGARNKNYNIMDGVRSDKRLYRMVLEEPCRKRNFENPSTTWPSHDNSTVSNNVVSAVCTLDALWCVDCGASTTIMALKTFQDLVRSIVGRNSAASPPCARLIQPLVSDSP